jgi:hypothetical protein
MYATDLDLELEVTEGEQALDPGPQPGGGEAPGVAWGHAEQHPAR